MEFRFARRLALSVVLVALGLGFRVEAAPASRFPDARLRTASAPAAPRGGVMYHAEHVFVPRLDTAPQLANFLGTALGGSARQMLRINVFVQRYPEDGKPPNEPTTAFLGYTHEYFFLAFVCNDRKPGLIRAHMLARDSLSDDDYVQVMLDTFHDERRAFIFESIPAHQPEPRRQTRAPSRLVEQRRATSRASPPALDLPTTTRTSSASPVARAGGGASASTTTRSVRPSDSTAFTTAPSLRRPAAASRPSPGWVATSHSFAGVGDSRRRRFIRHRTLRG